MEHKLKFYIVENDVFYAKLYENQIKSLNYHDVICMDNGFDCLSNLNQNPDIIFLEHNLHDITGLEVLRKIKRYDPNIFVIFISSQENIKIVVDILKYGAFDYIIKEQDVCEKIERVIKKVIMVKEKLKKTNPSLLQKVLSKII